MQKSIIFGATAVAIVLGGGAAVADNIHGKMPQTEVRSEVPADVARMFAKLDANKDGFVTQQEMDALREHRVERMEHRAEHFDATRMMGRFDTNKDGKITRAEADAAIAAHKAAKGKIGAAHGAERLFARADLNKDGVLTSAELASLKPSEKRMERMANGHGGPMGHMLGAADTNKDGKISLAEAQALAIQHFDMADANRDGKVSPEERKAARQKMHAERHSG